MTKPVVNIDEVEFRPRTAAPPFGEAPDRFEARFARIGPLVGARQLGYNIAAVPPGKSAVPYHSHRCATSRSALGARPRSGSARTPGSSG